MKPLFEDVTLQVRVRVDVDYLAEQFAALTDDAQAQFLCKAAALIGDHRAREMQAVFIGRHLRTCECSTEEGRDFLRDIVIGMEPDAQNSGAER